MAEDKKKIITLRSLKEKAEKDYPGYTMLGNDNDSFAIARIPVDIFSFDLLTGGGFPKDRFSIIWGNKSCGKSSLVLRAIGQFLRFNQNDCALLVDAERTYDSIWASHFIDAKDMPRLFVVQPDYGELAIDIACNYMQADDIGLICIDSLAMLIPTETAESAAGDRDVGVQARLVNKFFRMMLPILSQKKRLLNKAIPVLLINQPRVKFGGKAFGAQTMKVGGMMQDLVASLDIHMYAKEYKKVRGVPAKIVNTFTIEKNKVGLPKRSGEFTMILAEHDGWKVGDIDDMGVVIAYAKRSGIINKEGKTWKVGSKEFPSLVSMEEFFVENKAAFKKLKDKTLQACIDNPFSSDGEEEAGGE